MTNPQEQLVEMVGKDNAERYINIVKLFMELDDEPEAKVVNN